MVQPRVTEDSKTTNFSQELLELLLIRFRGSRQLITMNISKILVGLSRKFTFRVEGVNVN